MKTSPLLFDWPHRHRIQFLLPAAVILATLAHAGVLFLFDIIHPAPRFDGPNPARVYFLPVGSPLHTKIQGLLLSSDPALYAPRHGLPESDIATLATYTPQFAYDKPSLASLPHRPKTSEDRQPLAKPPATSAPSRAHTPRRILSKKSIRLTGNLTSRATDDLLQHPALPPAPRDTASFLVGISESGTVVHIIPTRSSGDSTADTSLMNTIRSLRFSAVDKPGTAWGMVEIRPGATP